MQDPQPYALIVFISTVPSGLVIMAVIVDCRVLEVVSSRKNCSVSVSSSSMIDIGTLIVVVVLSNVSIRLVIPT